MFLQRMTTKTGLEHNIYLPLREGKGSKTTLIANKTKREYLSLGNVNDKNTIDTVHLFMITYGLWDPTDRTDSQDASADFVPPVELGYHDISRMLVFYKMAVKRSSKRQDPAPRQTSNLYEQAAPRSGTQSSPPIATKHPESLTTDEQMSGDSDTEKPVRRKKEASKKSYQEISTESPEELPSVSSDLSDLSSESEFEVDDSSDSETEYQKEESTPVIKVPKKDSRSVVAPSRKKNVEVSDLEEPVVPRKKNKKVASEDEKPLPRKKSKKVVSEEEDEPTPPKKTKKVSKPVSASEEPQPKKKRSKKVDTPEEESEEEPVPKKKRSKKVATPEEESDVASDSEADESEASESEAEESEAEESDPDGSDTDPSESEVSSDDEPPSPVAPTKSRGRGGRGRGRGGATKYSVELLNKKAVPLSKNTRGKRGGRK